MGGCPLRAKPTGAIFEEVCTLTNFPKIFFVLFFIYICAMTFKEILRNCKQLIETKDAKLIYKTRNTKEKTTGSTLKKQNK